MRIGYVLAALLGAEAGALAQEAPSAAPALPVASLPASLAPAQASEAPPPLPATLQSAPPPSLLPPNAVAAPAAGPVPLPAGEPAPPEAEAAAAPESRLWRGDRHALTFIYSGGDGRFNQIEWVGRPDWDSLFTLADRRCGFECDFDAGIGFNIRWWSGPTAAANQPPGADLPPRVYDLFIDLGWQQRWCGWFATEVRAQPGLYTDFNVTPPDAFRMPGHALGLVQADDDLQFVFGVDYVARYRIKLLPAGGVLWRPTSRCEARLVFPEPKVSYQLLPTKDLWCYVRGEYGGGRWAYDTEAGVRNWVESSDLRVCWGLEWRHDTPLPWKQGGVVSQLEFGYVFDRSLTFADGQPTFRPPAGWLLSLAHVW